VRAADGQPTIPLALPEGAPADEPAGEPLVDTGPPAEPAGE
jgi:hypothetical protein